ncbi:MAG: AMP-binding protein [Deltaproteobacteria bacterium]|nr:AMP-binding protein [Deltaproteobacteria bacterium]
MIKARIPPENPDGNLRSYAEEYKNFSWTEVEKEFTWHSTGNLNIVHEAVDRWAQDEKKGKHTALIFEKAGRVKTFTYCDIKDISCQWANLLTEHGFAFGDRIFVFLPSCPEFFFSMLACARLGIICCVLFPTLGYDEIEVRLQNAKPRGIITHPDMFERLPQHAMTTVEHVFLTEGPRLDLFPSEIVVQSVLHEMPKRSSTRWVDKSTPLYLLYTTSGSTGPPKGVIHSHGDMVGHLITGKYVLDLRDDSIIWTDGGDPGWVTGIVYGMYAPFLSGITSVVQGDQFSASSWYRTLERYKISVWYTTPRTITRLMEAGEDLAKRYDFSHLRHLSTVGEALSPEQFYWAKDTLKHAPHDTWWMTETGMICVANFPSVSIRPGSMGKPVPGLEAAILDEQGEPLPEFSIGELGLRAGWPAMMTGLWGDDPRYKNYFSPNNWFLTGDMVTRDEHGYYYHQGRNDDLIKLGQRDTGPYEVEQVLSLHQAVAEAVAISVRPSTENPSFKAFIRIKKGFTPSKRLNLEIKNFVKANFTPEIPLSEVVFLDELPKTRSGILLRRVLEARDLGVPSGDPSKLEG